MSGSRDALLDAYASRTAELYRAQTLLLDCYAHLDDTLAVAHDPAVQSLLSSVGHFLETVPWVKVPDDKPVEAAIDTGFAPQVVT